MELFPLCQLPSSPNKRLLFSCVDGATRAARWFLSSPALMLMLIMFSLGSSRLLLAEPYPTPSCRAHTSAATSILRPGFSWRNKGIKMKSMISRSGWRCLRRHINSPHPPPPPPLVNGEQLRPIGTQVFTVTWREKKLVTKSSILLSSPFLSSLVGRHWCVFVSPACEDAFFSQLYSRVT